MASPPYAVCPLSLTNYEAQQSRNYVAPLSLLGTRLFLNSHCLHRLPLARRGPMNRLARTPRLASTGEVFLL